MNITPITKKYTNPYNACSISFSKKSNVLKDSKNSFYCPQTSVKNTLNEFSNSRGNCLADIDLCDIYISNNIKPVKKETNDVVSKNMTIKQDKKNIQFLADMDLSDAYELTKKENKTKNLQLPFGGAYPQYLIDQDAVEQYEETSNGINDIAKSTYCSFSSLHLKEDSLVEKLVKIIKSYL